MDIEAHHALSRTKRRPTGNDRQLLRHCRPPRWKCFILREQETHAGKRLARIMRRSNPFPNTLAKFEHNPDHFSGLNLLEGFNLLERQLRSELDRAELARRTFQDCER